MNRATKHRSCTCISLVDFSCRSSVQNSFLAIQVEETTVVSVTDDTTAAKSSATEEASAAEYSSNNNSETQENEKENGVAAEERAGIEKEGLQGTNG